MDDDLKRALAGYTLSVEQTRRILGTSAGLVRRGIHSGEIESIQIGGAIRVLAQPLRRKLRVETEAA